MDRSNSSAFKKKEEQFTLELQLPLDISRPDAGSIIRLAGILDWEEELAYLRGQLRKEQIGCTGSWDSRQEKRDERQLNAERSKEASAEKKRLREQELKRNSEDYQKEEGESNDNVSENEDEYKSHTRKSKIDVMGKISLTCDARKISLRDRIM